MKGMAFCYNGEVDVYSKFKSKHKSKQKSPCLKTKTEIMLNDKDEVETFGDNAKITLS